MFFSQSAVAAVQLSERIKRRFGVANTKLPGLPSDLIHEVPYLTACSVTVAVQVVVSPLAVRDCACRAPSSLDTLPNWASYVMFPGVFMSMLHVALQYLWPGRLTDCGLPGVQARQEYCGEAVDPAAHRKHCD
jgi:hypothetical protein